ncbi:sensor histidine kinase [Pseudanabaena sp. PCC 6802]|uniref:sensor histidine kinase n=1 Tax=Pseudanabaena sp. PCC 6802 TaxID=118173 RepID=UPI00034BCD13|nr:HAMP domain-containing sensor histidine kinase [Pseudanabaena sp. PCC 6802]
MKPGSLYRNARAQSSRLKWFWIVVGLFSIVFILEFSTPPAFIFGYLYIAPILLASTQLGQNSTIIATIISIALTLLNLWIPDSTDIHPSTIANRIIVVIALLVTAFLSDRNRYYQEAITQQQSQIQAKENLMWLREDFTSTLTHDLKTPLLGAIETLKALQQESFGAVSSAQRSVFATMIRSHQTSLRLLETLLDVYRNDTEGLTLHLSSLDLTALAEETASTLLDLATSRRVYLSFCYGESDFRRSLWVNGDALQLQRVLTNLLVNAINHSRRGDRVEIVLESQASYQVVKILDTGSGIQPDEFAHLFERFYQGHSDRQAKGTGLGLYLSRQIVAAHGGIIWAENRSPIGALFGFKLPAISPHPTPHDSTTPANSSG